MPHHEFSPSQFPAWDKCPRFDSDNSGDMSAADEGTLQHAYLMSLLNFEEFTGDISAESRQMVDDAAFELRKIINGRHFVCEKYLSNSEFGGTPDIYIIDHRMKTVTIIDYKSGQKRDYMPQLQAYGVLVNDNYCGDEKYNIVCIVVYGKFGIEKEIYGYEESAFTTDMIIESRKNEFSQPSCCEYCAWCSHLSDCSAVQNAIAKTTGNAICIGDPVSAIQTDVLSEICANLSTVEAYFEKLKSELKSRIENGEKVDGWKVKSRALPKTIIQNDDLYVTLSDNGFWLEDILKCTKMSLPDITETYAVKNNLSLKVAKEAIEAILYNNLKNNGVTKYLSKA